MAIDRRTFVAGAGAALAVGLVPRLARGGIAPDLFAACCKDDDGTHAVAVLDAVKGPVRRLVLPGRGHDVALRPGTREAVVFARRPGRFATVFDIEGSRPPISFESAGDRHFFGHGVYSSDGRLLLSTENDFAAGTGTLGIRDATAGYRPIGEFRSGGVGPHDIALLPDGRTLVVANGGIDTDPQTDRAQLNLADMRPSLAYVDLEKGDLLELVELEPSFSQLSIRHLAIGAGGVVVFGCQYEGPKTDLPPLVGLHRRGKLPVLLRAPVPVQRRLKNYVGSIAVDAAGEIIAATSPRGGIVFYFDLASGQYIGESRMDDVCGIASAGAGELLLASGDGTLRRELLSGGKPRLLTSGAASVHWDNHLIALEPLRPASVFD